MQFDRKDAKAWCKQHIQDYYEAPLTPITPDFRLDETGLRDNVEAYIDMGIPGLVVGGFLAEGWNMTTSEWRRYHEVMADAVAGRMDLWTIILESSPRRALEQMQFVESLGYTGAEIMNPAVQLKSDDEIFDYFKFLTDCTHLAVFLYRTYLAGNLFSHDVLRRLAQIDTVVGMKQGGLVYAETLKLRRDLPPDFIVSDPQEELFLQDLKYGSQVLWAEVTYILYGKKRHLMTSYIRKAKAGDWAGAEADWQALRPVANFWDDLVTWEGVYKTKTYAASFAIVKPWYEAIGLKAGPSLPTVHPTSPQRVEWLRERLSELGVC
ncbi:dihydrodipicolinate synthase family protein [Immundisolibacter sp.]|uniref:dihydrodipicolinate synthase family protein n=2 Tax=Immundisolibacter sp. TaxID=1934948 RepID=UPI003565DBC2